MSFREKLPTPEASQAALRDLEPVIQGEWLRSQGRHEEAEARYREALATFPEGSGGRHLVYNKLGVLYEEIGDPERAEAVYRRAAEEGSVAPFTYVRLAELSLAAGRCGDAAAYCRRGQQALKGANTDVRAELYFWWVFQRLKRQARRAACRSGAA
jgi:Flp pilus assembly protein TadD